jgi:hypothetical protein
MATLKEKIAAEQRARAMLEDNGVAQPDSVEYGFTCIRLIWEKEKLALVVEIDPVPEGFETIGECLTDPGEEAD